MVVALKRMMSDLVFWKRAAREGMAAAREQLLRFELAHCIRREFNRYHRQSLSVLTASSVRIVSEVE